LATDIVGLVKLFIGGKTVLELAFEETAPEIDSKLSPQGQWAGAIEACHELGPGEEEGTDEYHEDVESDKRHGGVFLVEK
jgi:hypothetical protein